MKTIALLVCGMVVVACSRQPAPKDSIEPGLGLGGVQLGITTDELQAQLGPPKQTVGPDRNGRSALVYPGGFTAVSDSNSLIVAVQAGENFTGRTREGDWHWLIENRGVSGIRNARQDGNESRHISGDLLH